MGRLSGAWGRPTILVAWLQGGPSGTNWGQRRLQEGSPHERRWQRRGCILRPLNRSGTAGGGVRGGRRGAGQGPRERFTPRDARASSPPSESEADVAAVEPLLMGRPLDSVHREGVALLQALLPGVALRSDRGRTGRGRARTPSSRRRTVR